MRTILTIIAFFSLFGLRAQQAYNPAESRELPRGAYIPCATQQQAAANDGADNAYFVRLGDWTREGNAFSTPFTVPFSWANRQLLLRIEDTSVDYEVFVNGESVAYNANGNLPAEFNITRFAKEGRNELKVEIRTPSEVTALESWKDNPARALGRTWLVSQPTQRVRDVLVKTWYGSEENRDVTAEVGLVIKTGSLNPRTTRVYYELLTPAGRIAAVGQEDMTLDMRREDTLRFLARIPADSLWSTNKPQRYTLRVKTQHEGRYNEYTEHKLGFRTVEMHDGQMSVNGTPITLRAKEVSPQLSAAEIAELRAQGYNTLRLRPGAVAPSLYETCDTMGMYVVAQAPVDTRRSGDSRRKGGNPSNDPAWRVAFTERAAESYHTSKRHPSVIAFSIAEKSANGICLYESYLNMKRFGDSRPVIYPGAKGEWNSDKLTLE